MGNLMRKWFAMLAEQTTYAGIPVYRDGKTFKNQNAPAATVIDDENFFLAGPFDFGSTGWHSFRVTRYTAFNKDGGAAGLRMYDDLSANSVNYWVLGGSTTAERSITSQGRYTIVPIPKAEAADMYMYTLVNDEKVYFFKGCNVTD